MKRILFALAWLVILLATHFTAYNAGMIDAYLEMALQRQKAANVK